MTRQGKRRRLWSAVLGFRRRSASPVPPSSRHTKSSISRDNASVSDTIDENIKLSDSFGIGSAAAKSDTSLPE